MCIANSMFELDKDPLDLTFGLLDINSLFGARVLFVGFLRDPATALAWTGLTGLVRPALL